MKWFNNPTTVEELKKEYKKLAIENHPDRGGRTEDMQEINAEYDRLFESLKNTHRSATGETYTAKTETTETPEQFRMIIEKLIHLDGINIEICGSWIWVTGNTYNSREELKKMQFKYSKNKNAWYYHEPGYHKKSRKSFSLDDIRDMFGSETVNGSKQNRLTEAI